MARIFVSSPAESFDAAISRVGLIYFPDRQQALSGIHRALVTADDSRQ